MRGIEKKRVFVSGAVQGIGRAVAERFLAEGASVLLTDAAPAEIINDVVDSLEDRYPGLAFGTRIDIRDEKQVADGFRYMQEALGGCDILVNNAGINRQNPSHKFTTVDFLAYSVSKGGLGNLTRTLALEYSDRGIRVNAVAPGATITPLNASWTRDPETRKKVESHIPLGRSASAEEIAGVFAFLASDDAAYITGQTIYVDGGLTLHTDFKNNWSS
jgi:glucose 1-dehydrogenase